jgi:hypothetical protein
VRSVVLVAAAVAALWLTALAGASSGHGITKHDRDVVRFFQHHPRLVRTPAGAAALASVLPDVVRSLQAAENPWAVPAGWANSSAVSCIESAESGDGKGGTDLFGLTYVVRDGRQVPISTWVVGEESPAEQLHEFWLLWNSDGVTCHGTWGQYDGCC